jgi:hypothetical protein
MGLAALNRARAAGLSDSQIKVLSAQQGIQFADQAAQSLGVPSNTQIQSSGNPLLNFMQPGSTAMGLSAVNRARAAGYSDQQIRELAARNNITLGESAAAALGGQAPSTPGAGSGSSGSTTPSTPVGPSPVAGAQQSYEQTLQSSASTGATSAAGAYQAAFQQSLQNYSTTGNAQQAYNTAANNTNTNTGPSAEFQAAYQNAVNSSTPSTNQQELANYQSAYSQALQGLSNQGATDADYKNYVTDYQTALNNATAANAQSQPTSYQTAYEEATKNQPSLSGNNEYMQMYNDLVKRTSEDYDKQISRYQEDLTKSQTEVNQARSERDAALERADQWEQRFNDDAAYASNEQLRGVRSGSSSTGSSSASTDLSSGRPAYSSSDQVSRRRAGVNVSSIRREPGDYEAAAGRGSTAASYV